jgi:thioredoxin 1
MGNLCFSGNSDRVGDPKKEQPVQDIPVTAEKTDQEKPVPEEKPVLVPSEPAPKPAPKPAAKMAGDHGRIHIINNSSAWKAKLDEAKSTGKIVVVDFTATWCGPCRLMAPIFTELSKKFENLIFLKVDVDEVQDVTAEWEVRAMPTFLFIKDGKQLDKIVGANKDELERKCSQYASTPVASTA